MELPLTFFPTAVFEELPSADNASGFRSGVTSGLSSATTTPMEGGDAGTGGGGGAGARLQRTDSQQSSESRGAPAATSRVLVASRHLRNDSKTIQLEQEGRGRSSSRDHRDLSLERLRHLALRSMDGLDLTVLPTTRCADDESKRLIESACAGVNVGGVLRHRRTGSRDLKTPGGVGPPPRHHKRTSSHHITMDPPDLPLQLAKGRSVDQLASAPLDPHV